ncbi:UvrD-helicase domain-containing protein [Pseudonocardia sp. GCM10023141]|uniref:UvrD-helicase domain-containing protein n=1 Tax=Pseudonocardia sp. GCM10023141 TaxID=3252653 RepID=UPI003620A4E6
MTGTIGAAVLAPARFDVYGALPTGTTVLEASAGTGKTFTIAALATRYVAEGVATLPELMLVTFGREATQELRERVRDRLVSAERGLADAEAARDGDDALLRLLASVDDAEVERRRARLSRALGQFDAATIATTHQFCQQMLAGLGVAGDRDPDAVFVESIDDLVTEVVDDFYVRKYGDRAAGTPAFGRTEALTLARRAVNDGQARLEPTAAVPGSPAQVRQRFATAVRAEVARRKRVRRLYTFDDMLTRLADALADPSRGAPQRLRDRYRVVLVDEFQDTDPVQWEILQRAFVDDPTGRTTLVLIGDPKQAIYAFRGADVLSYLDATEAAGGHATLDTNYRSDAPLLRALDTVFNGAALGDRRITVHPVESAHPGQRLRGAPVDTPLRVRVLSRVGLPRAPKRDIAVIGPARAAVTRDAAADIAALLAGPAQIEDRPIAPGDVAVLVRTNDQGAMIHAALSAAGVSAVLSGTASVFGTPIAREWLHLLEALEQPRAFRLRAAALTCFLGRTVAELCGPAAEALLDELGARVRSWAAVLHARGVAALLEAVTTDTALPQRLLGTTDGERRLTDLRHIAQALHAAAVAGHLGPAALVDWLRHRIDEAAVDVGTERSRRLESDAAAVQIITIHRSKGLEFPIVYVPFGWDRNVRDPDVPLLHDESGARVLDVGGESGEGWRERCARHRAEEAGEDLRLLYVAMTRARCQVVTWWVPATTCATSPVHRLLIGRPDPGSVPAEIYRIPTDTAALESLRRLASPVLAVEAVVTGGVEPAVGSTGRRQEAAGELSAAAFTRELDRDWRRTSYSALTAGAGHGSSGVASEPEHPGTEDEAPVEVVAVSTDAAAAAVPSPMAELPVGTGFGTLVHAIFEVADLTAPDLPAELVARAAEQLALSPTPGLEAATLGAALVPAARTPLGPLAGGLALADIAPSDRLAELDFELPLGGGDAAQRGVGGAPVTLGDLAPVLRRHLPAADPLHAYPDALESPALAEQPLRGYLTGSIDAVLRLPNQKFVVVDYKTNWLGPMGADGREPLTAAHYVPPLLAEAMIAANYPLQALLYGVALHRFLRWRLPDYDPASHLGGMLYLFVRGMCGPATPTVHGVACGVFGWAPPPELIVELSRRLDGATS